MVSKVIPEVIPRYTPLTVPMKQKIIQSMDLVRNQYLPTSTASTSFAQPQAPLVPVPKPQQPQQYTKILVQPKNIVKFVPKPLPCINNQHKEPIVQQHCLPTKLKIEPIMVFDSVQMQPNFSGKFSGGSGHYNAGTSSPQADPLAIAYPKRVSYFSKNVEQKRKALEKPPKKSTKKMKMTKGSNVYSYMTRSESQKLPEARKYGSDTDDSPMTFERRNLHNDMERQRRIGMRNLFVELKKAIPTLDERERVPKVNILKEAISYCGKVKRDEKLLVELRRKNSRLVDQAMKLGLSPWASGRSSTSSASSYNGYD